MISRSGASSSPHSGRARSRFKHPASGIARKSAATPKTRIDCPLSTRRRIGFSRQPQSVWIPFIRFAANCRLSTNLLVTPAVRQVPARRARGSSRCILPLALFSPSGVAEDGSGVSPACPYQPYFIAATLAFPFDAHHVHVTKRANRSRRPLLSVPTAHLDISHADRRAQDGPTAQGGG
jgi:hypothetical protein